MKQSVDKEWSLLYLKIRSGPNDLLQTWRQKHVACFRLSLCLFIPWGLCLIGTEGGLERKLGAETLDGESVHPDGMPVALSTPPPSSLSPKIAFLFFPHLWLELVSLANHIILQASATSTVYLTKSLICSSLWELASVKEPLICNQCSSLP